MNAYSPTRSAPPPPIWPRPYDELPADHPFLNPYVPRPTPAQVYARFHHTTSSSTLSSDYTVHTPPTCPARQPRTSAYTTSPTSGRSSCSTTSTPRSWLAAPLSPSRPGHLGHPTISPPKPAPAASPSDLYRPKSTSQPYIPLPTELSILDTRPRSNLLADIEFIVGKKLHFPLLHRWKVSEGGKKEEKEKKRRSPKSERSGLGRLVKQKRRSEEEEMMHEVVVIEARTKGRGVREGNWI